MVTGEGGSERGLDDSWAPVLERIRVAAERYRELQDAADDERELRDASIVAAMDLGLPYSEVAAAAGISPSRVHAIVVNAG